MTSSAMSQRAVSTRRHAAGHQLAARQAATTGAILVGDRITTLKSATLNLSALSSIARRRLQTRTSTAYSERTQAAGDRARHPQYAS
jgi:hypothetical protein